ncbi:hypothetical protein [Spirillospora sp. NPDC048824]|uniref:hypothetical protein n=1 Tax=Spirillospora sp. NPDC048824 TaxID=3364526 RepID=UPI00371E345E
MPTLTPPGPHAAIDLGSSRIRATLPARDVLVDRPSAVGGPAPTGRTGRTFRARPIEHGMVTDACACTRLTRLTLLEADPERELREILLAVPAAASGAQLDRAAAAVRAAAGRPVRTMDGCHRNTAETGRALDHRP